ncbi:MAG: hypothetical protein FH748_11070 [Balneolaceae bacterium]|nr:hypothetical protein [Balneolaceae bacterium]
MKNLVKTLLLIVSCSLASTAHAQVSASMQVKVNVVSGASIDYGQSHTTYLSNESMGENIRAGSFMLSTTSGSKVDIKILKRPSFINNKGDKIEFTDLLLIEKFTEKGEHEMYFDGKIKNKSSLSGNYKGQLTAVIEYL